MHTEHGERTPIEFVRDLLTDADALVARAVGVLARGTIEREVGISTEVALRMIARRSRYEARELLSMVDALRAMPGTAEALSQGTLGLSQVRGICWATRGCSLDMMRAVDEHVSSRAARLTEAEPDQLIWEVSDVVASLRHRAERARDARAIESSFLSLQGRLTGGGTIYGEADAASFATICEAIDHAAPAPADDISRGAQRFDGLLALCEGALSGSSGGSTRPRPSFLATVEVGEGGADAARVLGRVTGRPQRLGPLSAEVTMCDASITAVVTRQGRPIAAGSRADVIPPRLRAAIVARDGGCRGPGCRMPAAWCDVHHAIPLSKGGTTTEDNLLLLCRRCHVKAHHGRWKITHGPDDLIAFRIRGRTYTTAPRARTPLRR